MARGDDDPEPARVLPHVFLGSKAHARDRELLARLQITHVLNVRVAYCLMTVTRSIVLLTWRLRRRR